jgi:hypothetical protein
MNFKCQYKECGKEFSPQQLIGTIPPHIHLNAFCESCFQKIVEETNNKSNT